MVTLLWAPAFVSSSYFGKITKLATNWVSPEVFGKHTAGMVGGQKTQASEHKQSKY